MVILLLLWRAEGYHQSAVGHLSPFIHECRTYYLNSRRRYRVSLSLAGGHGDVSVQAADGGKNQSAKIQRSVGGWGSSSRIADLANNAAIVIRLQPIRKMYHRAQYSVGCPTNTHFFKSICSPSLWNGISVPSAKISRYSSFLKSGSSTGLQ